VKDTFKKRKIVTLFFNIEFDPDFRVLFDQQSANTCNPKNKISKGVVAAIVVPIVAVAVIVAVAGAIYTNRRRSNTKKRISLKYKQAKEVEMTGSTSSSPLFVK